ncbi:MAG: acetyl-CoA carboxylase carboxyl transferase subunit alpha, partial [Fibrobacterota bacterium]
MEYQTDSKVCEPVLDFEKPVIELERKILDMRNFTSSENFEFKDEIKNLEKKLAKLKKQVYSSLTPTQRVQIARHPKRPYTLDYIEDLMDDFVEFHGDRNFADDSSIVAGMAEFKGRSVCVVGHQKGK